MSSFPDKLGKSLIEESVFEIRFEPNVPGDAVFGIVFSAVKGFFPSNTIKPLPAQQLPEVIRQKDPNLKYQSLHRLEEGNLFLGVGPRSLVFGNKREYLGWNKWSESFHQMLSEIKDSGLMKRVERIGLRYINVINNRILPNTNVEITLNGIPLGNETSNLRTEIQDSGFIKILQIGNNVNIVSNNTPQQGSVIDIDCIYNFEGEDFFPNYRDRVELAHIKARELFFSLLKSEYIDTLNPEYEDEE